MLEKLFKQFSILLLIMLSMANPINTNVLSQNTICFETRTINPEEIPIPIEDAKFGILNFIAISTKEISKETDLLFVVDCSGSMSDKCSDERSKMQHIIHTLKNMILFLHEHTNAKINVTINAFDSEIYHIVTRTKITDENFSEIINKIDKLSPRGSTNIEFALRKSAEEITKLQTQFPSNFINHIFMTDGEATDGSKDIPLLQTIVKPDITNAFIGFGIEHDASLLNSISSVGKSTYYFIDKLESAGLVYGEILHGIIYKSIDDAEIVIENGFAYDYKTNSWVKSLKIGNIVSEANKTYNIISHEPENCMVNIKGNINDIPVIFPARQIQSADLTKQIYRQRTLQLLYQSNDFNYRKHSYDNSMNPLDINFTDLVMSPHVDPLNFLEEIKNFRLKLINFIEEIKKYMTDNNLTEDKFLKNLCDDIYICYRTLGTKYGTMYCTARQISQGTQRVYTSSSVEDINTPDLYTTTTLGNVPPIPRLYRQHHNTITHSPLFRQNNSHHIDEEFPDNYDLPILRHEVSDFNDTPYLTPQVTQLMREISRPGDDFNNEDTQEIY